MRSPLNNMQQIGPSLLTLDRYGLGTLAMTLNCTSLFLATQNIHFTSSVIARNIVTKQSTDGVSSKRYSLC